MTKLRLALTDPAEAAVAEQIEDSGIGKGMLAKEWASWEKLTNPAKRLVLCKRIGFLRVVR